MYERPIRMGPVQCVRFLDVFAIYNIYIIIYWIYNTRQRNRIGPFDVDKWIMYSHCKYVHVTNQWIKSQISIITQYNES